MIDKERVRCWWYSSKYSHLSKLSQNTIDSNDLFHETERCILANKGNSTSSLIFGIQCPLDMAALDKAAALPIATSTPVTNLINSHLG